jgi:hypothetical protein
LLLCGSSGSRRCCTGWLVVEPEGIAPSPVKTIYVSNLLFWLLLTLYIGIIVFRAIMSAASSGSNEIYGAIYVYLIIGVVFAEIYQLLLAWQPAATLLSTQDDSHLPLVITSNSLLTREVGDLYYSFVTLGHCRLR